MTEQFHQSIEIPEVKVKRVGPEGSSREKKASGDIRMREWNKADDSEGFGAEFVWKEDLDKTHEGTE